MEQGEIPALVGTAIDAAAGDAHAIAVGFPMSIPLVPDRPADVKETTS
jgi:hypothetical protein